MSETRSKQVSSRLVWLRNDPLNSNHYHCTDINYRDQEHGVITYTTNTYRLHHYETPTNLHFVLLTSPSVKGLQEVLRGLYSDTFNKYVVRNPMQDPRGEIKSQAFISSVDAKMTKITTGKI